MKAVASTLERAGLEMTCLLDLRTFQLTPQHKDRQVTFGVAT